MDDGTAHRPQKPKIPKNQELQVVHEQQQAAKLPAPKRTPWMRDEAGNRWRQVGDLDGPPIGQK